MFGAVIQDGETQMEEKKEEEEKEDDTTLDLAQEVFAHLKNQGIVIPEGTNYTKLEQTFKEVWCRKTV